MNLGKEQIHLVRTSTEIVNIKTKIENSKKRKTEMKNTLQGINCGVNEAEHQIRDSQHKEAKTPNENKRKNKEFKT